MSSLTNINNNASVINVGRTTPVSPGVRSSAESIPVVVATDQAPIPVVEQQKVQSEVALSLLGIPRSEVALGIFSDVNTYDVNPSEWSEFPSEYTVGHGVKHLPQEAGAIVQAPKDNVSVLSSKRFFRYQPGRVSAATFGVKSSVSPKPDVESGEYDLNPSIRKYGIFDKYDGYYWESRGDFQGDNFATVRRTQSLLYVNPVEFSNTTNNQSDYRVVGKPASNPVTTPNAEPRAIETLLDQKYDIIDDARVAARDSFTVGTTQYDHINDNAAKCERDMEFALDAYIDDLRYGGTGHTVTNATTYRTALLGGGDPDVTEAEETVHEYLRDEIKTVLASIATLNGVDTDTRIDALAAITINAVGGTQPLVGTLISTSTSTWARNKIETIFSIYKRYLGYLVSESYDSYSPPSGVTLAEIKHKCLRDVAYIVDGYGRDLAYGGDAGTVYNAKNYYFQINGGPLQVYSQQISGSPAEIEAHQLVKTLITKDGNITTSDEPSANWDLSNVNISSFASVFDLFGLGAAGEDIREKAEDLADIIIGNFTTPYSGGMDFGDAPQFGDLVVLRDGLLHIHAGVYDPTLLKAAKKVRVKVDTTDNTLTVAEGEFVVGQHINLFADTAPTNLENDKTYVVKSVSGPKSNIITLYDPQATDAEIDITTTGTNVTIEPNIPFVFPDVYQVGTNIQGETPTGNTYRKYDGMFPYMYVSTNASGLDNNGNELNTGLPVDNTLDGLYKLGFINTAIDTTSENYSILKEQIDQVNYAYNNWIKQNVDPNYYSVYEYRVPRSRFSSDKLDGQTRGVVYSDVATGEFDGQLGVRTRPGQGVTTDGVGVTDVSIWDIDMTKVTMLKIEFSWYGAVGAMFLAYVPVGSGEARWVRVHHMRASNQLKISSLGNATLPITYVTYGGGSVNKLGIPDATDKTYNSTSNHVVKYGSSYYIDGGDRGTVRLYSHANLAKTSVYGNIYDAGSVTQSSDSIGNYFTIGSGVGPTDKTFFMKSQIITNSPLDQNTTVIWVDGNKIYTSAPLVNVASVKLATKRPSLVFGLKAKENIFNSEGIGIRNRVQVYPTKMSTANYGDTALSLNVLKTPVFQTTTSTSGSMDLTTTYTISPDNDALPVSNTSYIGADGEFIYGWFRANVGTVFGRLSRTGGQYFFTVREVYNEEIVLFSGIDFLPDGRFTFDGSSFTDEVYESNFQKERLSSVRISNVIQTPIPETGSNITSFFLGSGSNQFDLLSYFDYNKEYLSYPLTDEVESVYLASYLTEDSDVTAIDLNASLTWEEQ